MIITGAFRARFFSAFAQRQLRGKQNKQRTGAAIHPAGDVLALQEACQRTRGEDQGR